MSAPRILDALRALQYELDVAGCGPLVSISLSDKGAAMTLAAMIQRDAPMHPMGDLPHRERLPEGCVGRVMGTLIDYDMRGRALRVKIEGRWP